MVIDQKSRPSAESALNHPFINQVVFPHPSKKHAMDAIHSIKGAFYSSQLQKAVLQFIVKLFLARNEKEGLSYLFEFIDTDMDGIITLSHMAHVFKDKFSMQITDEVLDKLDKHMSKKGQMTYTEFLMAACNKHLLLSEMTLKFVF